MNAEPFHGSKACGGYEGSVPSTPDRVQNRPGLTAIAYRAGTYATFRQAMIEAVSRKPELRDWTSRAAEDYGVALLEMWAYLADILTFYQERIANEAFLRTALLPESVQRLATLLNYELTSGVAATAYLAFTVDEGERVEIPEGLQVQSIPGQNERPQKFETVEAASATFSLNRVRVYPEPRQSPPKQGATEALLDPSRAEGIAGALTSGDAFVIFDTGPGGVTPRLPEEKVLDSLRVEDGRTLMSWSPALGQPFSSTSHAFRFKRKMRIFGYNAPRKFMKPVETTVGANSETITKIMDWQTADHDPEPHSTDTNEYLYDPGTSGRNLLSLDTRYDDLKPGTKLLFYDVASTPVLLKVSTVGQAQEELTPLSDTVTQVEVTVEVTVEGSQPEHLSTFDRRHVLLYELSEPEIAFWGYEYSVDVSGEVVARTEDLTEELLRGQKIVLADDEGKAELVSVLSVEPEAYGGNAFTRIFFAPSLKDPLDARTACLYGNVVKATQGETVTEEVLGSGDASSAFQSFGVRRPQVTFVRQPGKPRGAANTLEVRVGGALWEEVPSLNGHTGDERIYTTSVDEEGSMSVRFGDGTTGARLPTGLNNVVVAYRHGLGRDGNVSAGSLSTLLDRPVGLTSVTNPAGAEGGVDNESIQETRTNAPNTVRTFGRIVSLRDFEDAAREFVGVAKVRADLIWEGEEAVCLTVAGQGGKEIVGRAYEDLVAHLDSRRDTNRKLIVATYHPVPVQVRATVQVSPERYAETVRASANQALEILFDFDSLGFGQPVHLSDVYRVLQEVEGVVWVRVECLQFAEEEDRSGPEASDDPVQTHLRVHPGRLAVLDAASSAVITRTGVGSQ